MALLEVFRDWTLGNDAVRAAVLTGSRAESPERVDAYSDYDIRMYVTDPDIFRDSDDWLDVFGEVLVLWPLIPGPTLDGGGITRLVQYRDGHRLDLQIVSSEEAVGMEPLDNGYEVILDKDGILADLPEPSRRKYVIGRPSEKEFLETVNAFWWDALYVPKCLARGELPFASYMMECQLRHRFIHRMMEWHIGSSRDWNAAAGIHGRHFRELVDDDIWSGYVSTFASGSQEDHWRAFFSMLVLFRRLAVGTAFRLGYDYPQSTDEAAVSRCMEIFEDCTGN